MMKIVTCTIICFLVFISACVGFYQAETEYHVRQSASAEEGEAWCEMCVLVVDRMKVLIKEKDAEGKVNETLYELCGLVQGYMKAQCYQMIPMIRQQLTHEFDSKQTCKMMQLCGEDSVVPFLKRFVSKMDATNPNLWEDAGHILKTTVIPRVDEHFKQFGGNPFGKADFSFSCMLCKTAVGFLDKSLQVYEQPLVDFVIGICNSLPGPTNKACADAMGYYIPFWWDEVFKYIASPEEVCLKLRLCDQRYHLNPAV